jgi:hypothetical protein
MSYQPHPQSHSPIQSPYDEEIIQRNKIWAENINRYNHEKKNLEWGKNNSPKIITEKLMKQRDCIFNPITQTYTDKNLDINIRYQEKLNKNDIIIKNYDDKMRYEQTFNIINRNDKLKVFKNHENYPLAKAEPIRKKLEKIRIDHNIISNFTVDKHNFCKPEDRPIVKKEQQKESKKVNVLLYRDFDVISNIYKVDDLEKTKVDKKISEFEAANKFWKSNDYNLINGEFYDKERNVKMKNVIDSKTSKKHYTVEEE